MGTANRKLTSINLGSLLTKALSKKFGYLPSANKFANQFNLRAHGTTTITRETARKWLAGLVVPEVDKLSILIHWLEIEPSEIFKIDNNSAFKKSNVELIYGPQNNSNEHEIIKKHIDDCFNQINDESKKALFIAALIIRQLQISHLDNDLTSCNNLNQAQLELAEYYKKVIDLSNRDIKL